MLSLARERDGWRRTPGGFSPSICMFPGQMFLKWFCVACESWCSNNRERPAEGQVTNDSCTQEQFLEEQNPARAFAFATDDDRESPIHLI